MNPPHVDEYGDELDPNDGDDQEDAIMAEENPYQDVKLERALKHLGSRWFAFRRRLTSWFRYPRSSNVRRRIAQSSGVVQAVHVQSITGADSTILRDAT